MKKFFVFILCLSAHSLSSQAAVTCKDLTKEKNIKVIREEDVINEQNWKSIDVIANRYRRECKNAITQEVILVKGELLRRFYTSDDSCDGGNSYGSIYSLDLKTPLAHIHDGTVVCKKAWAPVERSENHLCDAKAESFATQKMKELGFEMTEVGSTLEIRDPYLYSFIKVTGTLPAHEDKVATVTVYMDRKTCNIGSATITDLEL